MCPEIANIWQMAARRKQFDIATIKPLALQAVTCCFNYGHIQRGLFICNVGSGCQWVSCCDKVRRFFSREERVSGAFTNTLCFSWWSWHYTSNWSWPSGYAFGRRVTSCGKVQRVWVASQLKVICANHSANIPLVKCPGRMVNWRHSNSNVNCHIS